MNDTLTSTAVDVRDALAEVASDAYAKQLQWFFKTGAGQYGEGDVFIGVRMPVIRTIVRRFADLPLDEIDQLLDDEEHEHRMTALLLLVRRYPASPDAVFGLYLAAVRRGRVNNWDLVDASADGVIGRHLFDRPRPLLDELAASASLWERRVAVLSTFAFIKRGDASSTLLIAERLLDDRENLIQKAVGWMLREVGKRVDRDLLLAFLDANAPAMPRVMLSYATEHLSTEQRAEYRARR